MIDLGQIYTWAIIIAGFIGAITTICAFLKKIIVSVVNKALEPLHKKIDNVDEAQCKSFLVQFFADIENGKEIKEYEKARAFECYEHYTNKLKKNSYIHDMWEKLMLKR